MLINIFVSAIGFFIFFLVLMGSCLFGAWCRIFFDWMEYERIPSLGDGKFFWVLIAKSSFFIAVLFVGIRYIVIPSLGLSPSWALLAIPVEFVIGVVLASRWHGQALEEMTVTRREYLSRRERERNSGETSGSQTSSWRKSETRQITLPVPAQCFEKLPGGVFLPIMDWSLPAGTMITIGPVETVLWDNNFHEVVPFRYNGERYFLRVHDIKIQKLAERLRARSNLRVVK